MYLLTTPHIIEAGIAISGASFLAAAYTSDQLVTLGTVAVVVIGAISTAAVAIINALSKRQEALINALGQKVTGIAEKAAVIEGHVNSEKTRNTALIQSQEIQMKMLQETIARMDMTARLLAQAATPYAPTVIAVTPGAAAVAAAAPVAVTTPGSPVVEAAMDDGDGKLELTTTFDAKKDLVDHVRKHGDTGVKENRAR